MRAWGSPIEALAVGFCDRGRPNWFISRLYTTIMLIMGWRFFERVLVGSLIKYIGVFF
jgi:hypothetical protein